MAWAKRIFLFVLLNLLIMISVTVLMQVFNIQPYLTHKGLNAPALMAFCLTWGMVGAFISLLLSKQMAKWMMGVQIIDPNTHDPRLRGLVTMVHTMARNAGLAKMPEVGIYNAQEINAFATGPSRSNSLVAVSSGLLQRMDHDQVEGVIAHEVAHIANGDMVTMTLLQGVVNAFVMFLARAVAFLITRNDRNERSSSGLYFITVIVLEILFMILGSMVIAWFSRYREFRADAGGAAYAGRQKMIAALEGLQQNSAMPPQQGMAEKGKSFQAFQISGRPSQWARLFSTHPPLEDRIARLRGAAM